MSKNFILVAEDDKAYGNVYQNKLVSEGFDVEVAENGQLALEAIRRRKPDVFLLDLMMPVNTGFDVLNEIQANKELQGFPILVMTNLSQDIDIEKTLKLGAKDYFVKSDISIQEMVAKVRSYLK